MATKENSYSTSLSLKLLRRVTFDVIRARRSRTSSGSHRKRLQTRRLFERVVLVKLWDPFAPVAEDSRLENLAASSSKSARTAALELVKSWRSLVCCSVRSYSVKISSTSLNAFEIFFNLNRAYLSVAHPPEPRLLQALTAIEQTYSPQMASYSRGAPTNSFLKRLASSKAAMKSPTEIPKLISESSSLCWLCGQESDRDIQSSALQGA